MSASVFIYEWNGTSGSQASTDKTSSTVRLKSADDSTVNIANPLVKPSTGNHTRSYEKWLRLHIGSTGPTGSITNPKWYTDGTNSFGTGIHLYIRTTNPGSYATPAVPADDSAGTDAFSFSSSAKKNMDVANPGPYTGTSTDIADWAVIWMTLDDTVSAPQNPTASETLTWAWDET
jgi:hypothetical protein